MNRSILALALGCFLALTTVARAEPLSGSVDINLKKVVNPDIIGCGVNFAFSDYEYIDFENGTEWTNIHSQQIPYPNDKKEWANFNRMMDYMGFQYVRFCVGLMQWEPVNDDADPYHLNLTDGFTFSPKFKAAHPEVKKNATIYMDQMHRLLDHWEKRDLYVVLANWAVGPTNFCPKNENWVVIKDEAGRPVEPKDRNTMNLASVDEFTESLTAIMYHLKKEKQYSCVQGISVWNEPEQMTDYFGTMSRVYRSLSDQLRRQGIRDEVKIQAFDGAVFWNRERGWTDNAVTRMMRLTSNDLDIISIHDYNTTLEYAVGPTTSSIPDLTINKNVIPAIQQAAKARPGKETPVIVGEFGSGSIMGQGGDAGAKAKYLQRLHNAEGAVQVLNNGGKAIAFWTYNTNYHTHWRMVTFDEKNPSHFTPDKTNYYPLALLMKYIKRGSDIVSTEVSGLKDANGVPRVFATTATLGKDVTILLVNDSETQATVKLNGVEGKRRLRQHYVTNDSHDRINDGGTMASGDNTISLLPQSITVLTTYSYGSETVD